VISDWYGATVGRAEENPQMRNLSTSLTRFQ